MCHLTPHLPCKPNSNQDYLISMKLQKTEQPDMTITSPLIHKGIVTTPRVEKDSPAMQTLLFKELISIAKISLPMILTGLLLYCRSMISMLFLGHLGELALAGGSLAVGFANITGYSILSGLAVGMEPICGQAYGAKKFTLLGLCLQRTVLLLLFTSLPISLLWLYMKHILLLCGQDEDIATQAQFYLLYSIPDLLTQSFLHPLRIYLRTQSITLPLTLCATLSILLHVPINYLLVFHLNLGIKGVALSGVWTNLNLVVSLILYVVFSGTHKKTWGGFSVECFTQWKSLLNLAIPSCISVCLEWWWYEIMILLCGLLVNPRATVASMGILIQTTSLLYIFPSSISFSVSTRVGNKLGAQKPSKARLSATVGLTCSFVLGALALVFTIVVRNIWASMFTQDQEIITLTSLVLPIIGLCELGNCPQTTGGMPVAVWLGFFAGFDFQGLWLGLLAAQGSCAVTMLVVLSRTDWDFEALRAKKLTSVVVVDDDDDGSKKVGAEKAPKAEIKEDSLSSLAESDEDKQSWV
ncbi:hypothetical protein VIGAN_08075500 [Vigna angularis var. angularis]|uniref:Protein DETOXIFICATION n=1 Tax=Vigna angularis var. angularis TaxID=157739 RepID=A0A0S3SMZ3_PHAAN|nr:hypothetical protein VIGAN_08075500 [Vigna angularis var. angularis]